MPPAVTSVFISDGPKNKKIVFDDDGEILAEEHQKGKKSKKKKFDDADEDEWNGKLIMDDHSNIRTAQDEEEEEDYFAKREKAQQKQKDDNDDDSRKKWFNVYPEYGCSVDILDMKESEQIELFGLCKSAFESEQTAFAKRNPSDARWLQTALHKGTAKDRANAGALLVTSNPLGNLTSLNALIGFTKLSNKASSEVMGILTDLWQEVLLPPHRKLISIPMRGADWKQVRKNTELSKEQLRRIYAYWHFENELKDQYFEFLKNLQHGIQTGQENNKNASIIAASQLLAYAPEKEQMLLTMLINKLGDPLAKIASKALHHLSEVALKHPNMCGVIVAETEKLLFRNNISDRAQHFALCFLASIAPAGRPEVCTKLVHICFSLFKVLVQKGAVNNRTMQAILRCLQKAIVEAKPANGSTEIMTKEMQDTIYRLVHLADIRISVQTLSLLLQLVTVKTEKSDRFYNALYKKMLDLEVTNVGTKTAAQLLHIIHRAIHIDGNVPRMQAFIKRLLQIALFMPPSMTAGCLIVIHKLFRSRKELLSSNAVETETAKNSLSNISTGVSLPQVSAEDEELAKFDSDGEEKYEDIKDEKDESEMSMNQTKVERDEEQEEVNKRRNPSSWHHANIETTTFSKMSTISASKYDPYHRVPSYAGAEYALQSELLLLREHFHPTVQVFADSILNQKRIDYYGDPLRDFGLAHFLERFAFKNPKKLDQGKAEMPTISHKRYVSYGARGKPVKSLTKANCTEDEMFIFNYLEQKRMRAVSSVKSKGNDDEDDLNLKPGEVNDDEFEEYLDGYFGKNAKIAADAEDEMDFLKELGGELKEDEKKQKKKKKSAEESDGEDDAEIDADWGDEDIADEEFAGSDVSDDETGSIDLDGGEDDDEEGSMSLDEVEHDGDEDEDDDLSEDDSSGMDDDEDDELSAPKSKKPRKQTLAVDSRSFAKKLKHSDDMSSLFAAADDFAELLEETGKTKGQGTTNAILNKDKSSEKQLKWEEKRRSNTKNYIGKKMGGKKFGGGKSVGKRFAKKRKN